MPRLINTIFLLCSSCLLNAQNNSSTQLTEGAALLFTSIKTGISVAEKNNVFKKLQLKLTADKKGFEMEGIPVAVFVYPTDMNKDGREEIFIGLHSGALFGNVEQSFSVFMKNSIGEFTHHNEIAGGRPMILSTASGGYPDILIGGPGFEYPVLRWSGNKYTLHRTMKDESLNEKNSTDIEVFSKLFTAKR